MTDTLICYDIAHPRRLVRMHRTLKKHAVALQYSVFLFTGDERRLDRVLDEVSQLIDPAEDDLRAYPLPKRGFKARLGKASLPEGIQWSGLPAAWSQVKTPVGRRKVIWGKKQARACQKWGGMW